MRLPAKRPAIKARQYNHLRAMSPSLRIARKPLNINVVRFRPVYRISDANRPQVFLNKTCFQLRRLRIPISLYFPHDETCSAAASRSLAPWGRIVPLATRDGRGSSQNRSVRGVGPGAFYRPLHWVAPSCTRLH